jgi:hypothetical protein
MIQKEEEVNETEENIKEEKIIFKKNKNKLIKLDEIENLTELKELINNKIMNEYNEKHHKKIKIKNQILNFGLKVKKFLKEIVCISDTHEKHLNLNLPKGDILIHSGDFSLRGKIENIQKFNDFLGLLPYKHKIVIAGIFFV